MSILDKILDPENTDPIVLYEDCGEPCEFEQIAVIPILNTLFVILHPLTPIPGVPADTGMVFAVEEKEDGNVLLVLKDDKDTVDQVFKEYYEMLYAEAE